MNPRLSIRFSNLSVDGSAKGVPAGGEINACVHMLEHDVAVPPPEVLVARHRPHVAGIAGAALPESGHLLKEFRTG